MTASSHFGCQKFTFDRISGHLRSIRNFNFFENFDKMAAIGHFGYPKFTFDRISGHFRSIRNFYYFGVFLQNGSRRPFWISEIHFRSHFWPFQIDTQLYFFRIFLQNGCRQPSAKWLPSAIGKKSAYSFDITESCFKQCHLWTTICSSIRRGSWS